MRKRLLLGCGCVLVLGAMPYPVTAGPQLPPPVLACAAPAFDAGATTNRTVEHTFGLRNEGGSALTISRVAVCCGASCVVTPTNVPAGASAEVRVRIELAGRHGPWRKALYVHSNDPERTIFALRLNGTVVGPGSADDFDDSGWQAALGSNAPARRIPRAEGSIKPAYAGREEQ